MPTQKAYHQIASEPQIKTKKETVKHEYTADETTEKEKVDKVIKFLLLYLAAPLAVISILTGGILMITAGGNQNQLERSKSIFYNTVIGIIIAFGAWLIVNLILQNLLDPDSFKNPLDTIETCKKII